MKVELQCGDTITIPKGCKAIVKDGSVVFEKEQKFKDGDILALAGHAATPCPFIYKNTRNDGCCSYYLGIDTYNSLSICTNPNYHWGKGSFRYATKEEKQLLFDKMKEKGLKWNAEEKKVEKIKWRAECGEKYYRIDLFGNVFCEVENGRIAIDNVFYDMSNYFHTKEQAQEAAKRMKEVLLKYREEIGE